MLLLSNHSVEMQSKMAEISPQIIYQVLFQTMIKSISQAMDLSIHLANTIVSIVVVADDDDVRLASVLGVILLLSNITTMTPTIRIIIPATIRIMPAIIPLNEPRLTLLFAPMNGRLPAISHRYSQDYFPNCKIVTAYFPVISGLNVVKNCFVKSLLVIIIPFGFVQFLLECYLVFVLQ